MLYWRASRSVESSVKMDDFQTVAITLCYQSRVSLSTIPQSLPANRNIAMLRPAAALFKHRDFDHEAPTRLCPTGNCSAATRGNDSRRTNLQ